MSTDSSFTVFAIAVVGVLGTCVGGLIWVIKHLFNNIIPALSGITKSTDSNTRATKAADKYLRQRNGRDSEIAAALIKTTEKYHIQLMGAIAEIPKTNTELAKATAKTLVDTPAGQAIKTQNVDTQIISGKH